ncbi:hypothetical protein PFISCL1PPCAC_8186, partial [Pristionchus fissidentatus]
DDSLDLLDTLREAQTATNLFMNNRFELAEERMTTLADRSIYHAVGLNTIRLIKATMTCEKTALEEAVSTCKSALALIDSRRQKWSVADTIYSFGEWTKAKAIAATDEEIHAELCYAETLMFRSLLTFFQDESLTSFVRGALKIRTCHSIYKSCYKILEMSEVWEHRDPRVKDQFESGVRLGVGCFSLMISCLPPKVLKLLQVVGFTGDKEGGLAELHLCISHFYTLRGHLGGLILLSWNLIACYFLGVGEPNLEECHTLIRPFIQKFPNGSLILFLRARLCLVSGRVEEAIRYYNASIQSQDSYRQFHHGCFWELIFAHCFLREWHIAAAYAKRLAKESRWSRTIYLYYLSILLSADNTSDRFRRDETVQALLIKVDRYRSRIAGKSIPMEKFCSKRASRGLRMGSMPFANYEFLYFWNAFEIIGSNRKLMEPLLEELMDTWADAKHSVDVNEACLYRFLRGLLSRHLGKLEEAEYCFNDVIRREYQLTELSYLIPNAHYELGIIKQVQSLSDQAENHFNAALRYRSYALENKLHFRVHGAMKKLG